jgi:hypothetical protein
MRIDVSLSSLIQSPSYPRSASTSFVEATRWGEPNTAAINGPTQRTSASKRLRQTFQVLWSDLDQAMPRRIDIGYQKEGRRNDKW